MVTRPTRRQEDMQTLLVLRPGKYLRLAQQRNLGNLFCANVRTRSHRPYYHFGPRPVEGNSIEGVFSRRKANVPAGKWLATPIGEFPLRHLSRTLTKNPPWPSVVNR